ncbi:hypothetical protein [Sulfuricurvum sp.]|nr:hypothetical protein [Sulfuricurvum sp.]MDD3596884.1 hypothetical protein [Sulfuricurvum sp.]
MVDVVNNANKRNLFEDIEEVRMMKDIRNIKMLGKWTNVEARG